MSDMISRAAAIAAVAPALRSMISRGHAVEIIAAIPAQPAQAVGIAWTGIGHGPYSKADPNCQCICHQQPGVMHVAACCHPPTPPDSAELDALVDAYEAGAMAVHQEWKRAHESGEGPPRGEPEFQEAASDFAALRAKGVR